MMTPERWQQVKCVLQEALEIAPDKRPAFLDRACSSDHSLRREVESLIARHEQVETRFLNTTAGLDEVRFRLLPGKRIGAYEITDEIAHGGMGVVYGAMRADGQYKQQVALKIMRADLDAELTVTRFRNERQILASLEHPNIAKILDGGTTTDGIPYFVMEFVDGLPITEYCDKHELSIDSRLQIFRTICSAITYAHQHLVIHRDLKPSNILMTTAGIPKLLDFGIAKILDPTFLPEHATLTASGQWLMTPEYASPEQLRGDPITTATDVYSLGLVLYTLLTGQHAYRFASRMAHDIARTILDSEPEKPSTAIRSARHRDDGKEEGAPLRLEVVSGLRGTSPEKLRRRLLGDLDNIVLKAIRKTPRERYNSVEQFAEDIRQHLEGLPVLARKSTVAYRCRKYVLRHKVGVAAGLMVLFSLLTGVVLTLREARIARANQTRAEQRFNDVRALANSLIFGVHDSIQAVPGATSARKLVVAQGLEYLDRLSGEATDDPGLQKELAEGYEKLGDVQGNNVVGNVGDRAGAIASYRKAVKLRESLTRRFPQDVTAQNKLAECYQLLARVLSTTGNQIEADAYLERALGTARPLAEKDPNNGSVLYTLGKIEWQRGASLWRQANLEAALSAYRESADTFARVATLQPADVRGRRSLAIVYKHIGGVLEQMNRLDEAAHSYRLAYEIDQQLLTQEPENAMRLRDSAVDFRNLGDISVKQNQLKEARKEYESAIGLDKRLVESDPADRDTQLNLASDQEGNAELFLKTGNGPAALSSLRAAVKVCEEQVMADPSDGDAKSFLAHSYALLGDAYWKLAQSAPQLRRATYRETGCSAYNKALTVWKAMQTAGLVNKEYESDRLSLGAKVANCK